MRSATVLAIAAVILSPALEAQEPRAPREGSPKPPVARLTPEQIEMLRARAAAALAEQNGKPRPRERAPAGRMNPEQIEKMRAQWEEARKREAEEEERRFTALLDDPLSKAYTLTLHYANPDGGEGTASMVCSGPNLRLELPIGGGGDGASPPVRVELEAALSEVGDGKLEVNYSIDAKSRGGGPRAPRIRGFRRPGAGPPQAKETRKVTLTSGVTEVIHEDGGQIFALSFR